MRDLKITEVKEVNGAGIAIVIRFTGKQISNAAKSVWKYATAAAAGAGANEVLRGKSGEN